MAAQTSAPIITAPGIFSPSAAVSLSSFPPAGAFQVAHQMTRSPLVGPRPKRAPRPQISQLSRGSGTEPGGVSDRTAV